MSPSERSTQPVVAGSRASACPASRRGVGRCRSRVPVRSARSRASAPAPRLPVTKSRSPALTRPRRRARPRFTRPRTVIVRLVREAAERLPPTSGQPCRIDSAITPSTRPSKTGTESARGTIRLSRQPTGSAPIAARSERFTINARRPIVRGASRTNRKCTSSTTASTERTTSEPVRGRRTAASSPIASGHSLPEGRPARRLIRSIRADSPRSANLGALRGITQT